MKSLLLSTLLLVSVTGFGSSQGFRTILASHKLNSLETKLSAKGYDLVSVLSQPHSAHTLGEVYIVTFRRGIELNQINTIEIPAYLSDLGEVIMPDYIE